MRADPPFNILAVVQSGRLQYEAVLLAASLRAHDPSFSGRLLLAEPQPTGAWAGHPTRIDSDAVRAALDRLGAEIVPFEAQVFGASYPQGNKIEALSVLPAGAPFLFLDTDTLVTGPLSTLPLAHARPSASMQREETWPRPTLYGPGLGAIWKSLYDRFDLDFASSLDLSFPDGYWQRYLYFNAGWFCGPDPAAFHARYLSIARAIRDDPPPELATQPLDPWLDQVALPLAVHAQGGGRPGPELAGLDGELTSHWRVMSLFFARAPDRAIDALYAAVAPNWIKKTLKEHLPFRRFVFQSKGARVRAMFDRAALPQPEETLRRRIRNAGLWLR